MGYRYLNTVTAAPVFAEEPPVVTKGSLYYNSTSEILYISNGTQWNLVSNASPATTGGTVTISAVNEGGTFSYNLGTDFEDDVDTDAELTYSLVSGTLPVGCSLPTTGNTTFTGTASGVSIDTNYTWTIKATDTSGGTATQDYQQTINTVAATTTGGTVTISAVTEGSSASYDVNANFTFGSGSIFYAYSLISGSLPLGLSLNASTGVISGTMGEVANTSTYSFTIRATDTDGDTVDQSYSWAIINVPFTATGGTITNISGYRVHTFTSSGNIIFNKSGVVDMLIIAGGGSGGYRHGAGGGAGGYRYISGINVSASTYTATIGAGGAGGIHGISGSSSNALGYSVVGGGGAGSYDAVRTGYTGGSGGGSTTTVAASGTPGQGNSGGVTNYGTVSPYNWGGGGGAGGAGGTGTTSAMGAGGIGLSNSINGSSICRAGGGGGGGHDPAGSRGYATCGGGNGGTPSVNSPGDHGVVNTGGGGGGATTPGGGNQYGGYGGSGIVIIRYAV